MKFFNHIWIFSDSIAGHEIQSKALASKLSNHIALFHCTIRQPWLSFAPRILPRFGKNIIWEKQPPDISKPPDAIITCGRRMAAIGKYYKRQFKCKHIQILNPGDSPKKYDILVCPEHDGLKGSNIVTTKGSLHSISPQFLSEFSCKENTNKPIIGILLGNPSGDFFSHLGEIANDIKQTFPNHQIMICGSRRTPSVYHSKIKNYFIDSKLMWLDHSDGENPYLQILACSEVLVVTADSINMLSEACASNKPVIAIGQKYILSKHKIFVDSIVDRLSKFDELKATNIPFNTSVKAANIIIKLLTTHKGGQY